MFLIIALLHDEASGFLGSEQTRWFCILRRSSLGGPVGSGDPENATPSTELNHLTSDRDSEAPRGAAVRDDPTNPCRVVLPPPPPLKRRANYASPKSAGQTRPWRGPGINCNKLSFLSITLSSRTLHVFLYNVHFCKL